MGEILDKTKGKIKQAVGDLTGDKDLKREGENDEAKGRVKGVATAVKGAIKDVKHAVKDVKRAIKAVAK